MIPDSYCIPNFRKLSHFDYLKCSINTDKLGGVVRMVVDSTLPHAESGSNDYRKDAPPFNIFGNQKNPWGLNFFQCSVRSFQLTK